ncbi:DnaJ domain-containing protein [Cynara cardunculus var. scolymus]|uniref:DnaJ domain-containing protein n=1 Tax=Cynara cardunculus var. scolymus TaxID=59895 RepID=A0A103XXR8_CYNCS|nr:DnaJ domain-containing protein [Cynara cardunculus var. scolymus]
MATTSEIPKPKSELLPSIVMAYWLPAILFCASMFFQLVAIPRSFPPSHYDVLGIKSYGSIEQVNEAYRQLSSKWNTGKGPSSTLDMIKSTVGDSVALQIQYAFEVLSNPVWKRDYDIFGLDEHLHVMERIKEKYSSAEFADIHLPLLEPTSFESDQAFDVISSENYISKLQNSSTLLVQVFSNGSSRCAQFSSPWKQIASLLDGIAQTGMIEIGDLKLATYLSEKRYTGAPFFRNGLPSLLAFPPGCKTSDCVVRYTGELSVDAVTDWFATTILSLPRITYYSRESLAQSFLEKGSRHKDSVPLRSCAKLLKLIGLMPHSPSQFGEKRNLSFGQIRSINNSRLIEIMEQNKHQVLPQLRSATSMELGCDPKGYSRAGNDTTVWYCAVLLGRQSAELHKMRETMRRVQEILSNAGEVDQLDQHQRTTSATVALKEKRLTFAWVDGEAQKRFCLFYVNVEDSYDTCGPRRDIADVPRLVLVRYKRNDTEVNKKVDNNSINMFASIASRDVDPTSQLVALYKGLDEIPQIIKWISETVRDGDSRDLPFHRTSTPELVPEDADPIWSRGREQILSSSRGMKQKLGTIPERISDLMSDPRLGPMLLLGALMSFGFIYLRRNQLIKSKEANNSNQPKSAIPFTDSDSE